MKPRLLALDYGEKRIGVALSDPLGLTAQPRPYIPTNKQSISAILTLCQEVEVTKIYLGLPKNRHGEDTKKTTEIRQFSEQLSAQTDIPIIFADEAYSTQAMTKHLIANDVSRKKRKEVIDSLAAAYVLQGVLDRR